MSVAEAGQPGGQGRRPGPGPGQGRSLAASAPDPTPWYRQFWPWVLILLPLTSVLGGVTALLISMDDPDGLVVDDYYRAGLAINRTLERQELARQSGILARGQLDPGTGDVVLGVEGLREAPGALTLRLAYATRAAHDQQVEMHALPGGGRFAGQLGNRLRPGAWTVTLEPAGGAWRVAGRVVVDPKAERIELLLAP